MSMSVALDLRDFEERTPHRLASFLAEPGNLDLDWRRFEIVDGMLIVSPSAGSPHERLVIMLGHALAAAAPSDTVGIAAAMIRVGRSYLVTDVTVVTGEAYASDPPVYERGGVLVAVEIEWPSSITTDRITKPAQYADVGIPYYWRVETDPLRLVTNALDGDAYVETGSWAADETARVTDPFPVTIDLSTLLPG